VLSQCELYIRSLDKSLGNYGRTGGAGGAGRGAISKVECALEISREMAISWGWVKTLVPCREAQVIAGIYGCE